MSFSTVQKHAMKFATSKHLSSSLFFIYMIKLSEAYIKYVGVVAAKGFTKFFKKFCSPGDHRRNFMSQ